MTHSTLRPSAIAMLVLLATALPAHAATPAAAKPAPASAPTAQAPAAPAAAAPTTPFDAASQLYQQGKQQQALVTLQQLAAAGDARAEYLVGLDMIEGKYIPRDYARGFAYIVLASEDTQFGDLVAPRAKEARAVVEPQLSGTDLIHADAIIAELRKQRGH